MWIQQVTIIKDDDWNILTLLIFSKKSSADVWITQVVHSTEKRKSVLHNWILEFQTEILPMVDLSRNKLPVGIVISLRITNTT